MRYEQRLGRIYPVKIIIITAASIFREDAGPQHRIAVSVLKSGTPSKYLSRASSNTCSPPLAARNNVRLERNLSASISPKT
jgi:hypothetical protein